MNPMPPSSFTAPAALRWITFAGLGLLVLHLIAQAPNVPWRFICPDEAQHLHAARRIAEGLVVYRDFFEHHGFLYYYLLAPLVGFLDDPMHVLFVARGLSGLLWIGSLGLMFRLGQRVAPSEAWRRPTGLVAVLLLAGDYYSFNMAIEVRPDSLMLPLLLGSLEASLIAIERASWRWSLVSGLLLGLLALSGPRAFIVAVAMLAVHLVAIFTGPSEMRRGAMKRLGVFIGACLIPIVASVIGFGLAGAFDDLVAALFRYNLRYKVSNAVPVTANLRDTILLHPVVWVAGLAGLAMQMRAEWLGVTGGARHGVAIFLLVGLLSLLFIHQAAPQHFFVNITPFLALSAAWFLIDMAASWVNRKVRAIDGMALALLMGLPVLPAFVTAWYLHDSPVVHVPTGLLVGGSLLLGTVALVTWHLRMRGPTLIAGLLLLVWMPLAMQARIALLLDEPGFYDNRRQMAGMHQIQAVLPTSARVHDGFSGLGFMHPAIGYHGLLHDQSIEMLGPERLRRTFRKAFALHPPELVLFTRELLFLWGDEAAERFRSYDVLFWQKDQVAYIPQARVDVIALVRSANEVGTATHIPFGELRRQ